MGKEVKSKSKKKYDTFSITMELERPLLEDLDKEYKNANKPDKKQDNNRKIDFKKIITGIILVLALFIVGFLIWANNTYKPKELALDAIISDKKVEVTTDKYITFSPRGENPSKGFIFYPGARVDPEAYAPMCRKIAEEGYEVVVVPMTFNLATFSSNKGEKVIEMYDDIDKWVVGGHSLGGTMAAKFASNNNRVDGVVLLAAYPMGDELKNLNKDVISIWGSKDGVINYKNLIDSKSKLPEKTTYVDIEGGNHSQFADYGKQKGDEDALISLESQIDIATNNILKFLKNVD